VTPNYVALCCTGTVLQADTGASIIAANNVEANYTSYARLSLGCCGLQRGCCGRAPAERDDDDAGRAEDVACVHGLDKRRSRTGASCSARP
jgi:hypothetical protein